MGNRLRIKINLRSLISNSRIANHCFLLKYSSDQEYKNFPICNLEEYLDGKSIEGGGKDKTIIESGLLN